MNDASDTTEKARQGIAREHLQGNPKDPTGKDLWTVDEHNDQQMPAGAEGVEGGSAGKFTRSYREDGESTSDRPAPKA